MNSQSYDFTDAKNAELFIPTAPRLLYMEIFFYAGKIRYNPS